MAKRLRGYKKFNLFGIEFLKDAKNLLGFSYQVDSTCLFYLLLANNIDFDIAIVNYGLRKKSILEVEEAKILAKKYNKKIFIANAPEFKNNFESSAREFRRTFFKHILQNEKYENLVLANQLNDKVEWFLMQFSKGCGLNSLLGFQGIDKFYNFNLVRPLVNTPRSEIKAFLKKNKIKYFIDKSNKDKRFLRNYFRKNYANKLTKKFAKGVNNSFIFLKSDYDALYNNTKIHKIKELFIFSKVCDLLNLNNISLCAKQLNYVISTKQRSEILKAKYSCVIASKIVIDCNDDFIFVSKTMPIIKHIKQDREILRLNRIPVKIRNFIDLEILEKIRNLK